MVTHRHTVFYLLYFVVFECGMDPEEGDTCRCHAVYFVIVFALHRAWMREICLTYSNKGMRSDQE